MFDWFFALPDVAQGVVVVYSVVLAILYFIGLISWGIATDINEIRFTRRVFIYSPIWPIVFLYGLGKLIYETYHDHRIILERATAFERVQQKWAQEEEQKQQQIQLARQEAEYQQARYWIENEMDKETV